MTTRTFGGIRFAIASARPGCNSTAVTSPCEDQRLAAGRSAPVEHALAGPRADDERGELRGAAHRPHALRVDTFDDVGAGHVGRLADRLVRAHLERRRLVLRAHQRQRSVEPEVAPPDIEDPIGVGVLDRPFGERGDEAVEGLGEPAHDRVRERHCALALRRAHQLDGVVDDRMHRLIGPRELVGAEPQRGAHGRIELAHRPLARLLDPEVDRARPLHRAVREPLGQRAVAVVEAFDGGPEGAVRVRVLLEDAAHDLERGAARRSDHRTPRRNSS